MASTQHDDTSMAFMTAFVTTIVLFWIRKPERVPDVISAAQKLFDGDSGSALVMSIEFKRTFFVIVFIICSHVFSSVARTHRFPTVFSRRKDMIIGRRSLVFRRMADRSLRMSTMRTAIYVTPTLILRKVTQLARKARERWRPGPLRTF